jgi:transketolase N-terminal domain/subunit
MSAEGLEALVSRFSTPAGFASHVNAETPGSIHEGGELGYALAVSWGAVMDKPDLITVCVVGDGEAETGPTATAWHAHKVCISYHILLLLLTPNSTSTLRKAAYVSRSSVSTATRSANVQSTEQWTTSN